MSKSDMKKVWACVVVGLLAIIAVCAIDVVLILNEGIEVEYVVEDVEGE